MLTPSETTLEQQRQLRELGAQHPAPTREEVMPDWKWVNARLTEHVFDTPYPVSNKYIAVYNQQIVGSGDDQLQLRLDVARKLGLHPERLVITFVFGD